MKERYYSCSRKFITPQILTTMGQIEAKIFRLYAAQVKITDYYEDIDTSWDRY